LFLFLLGGNQLNTWKRERWKDKGWIRGVDEGEGRDKREGQSNLSYL
jgi:hypothetical protein